MQVHHGDRFYEVGKLVSETDSYRLYLCHDDAGKSLLLQIAVNTADNGGLDRAAFILTELARLAGEVEEKYAKVKSDPNEFINYQLGFPELVDSFVCPEQDGRRINILAFRHVDVVTKMVPIINITDEDHLRVDLKTSAWIMGKLLKMLTFMHSEGITLGKLGGNNILIEPNQHYVVIFDWSETQTHVGEIPSETLKKEIAMVADAVITVLGGNPETGEIPDDGEDGFAPYTEYVLRLSRGEEVSAKQAHQFFYGELISNQLGWKGFHPFTTRRLGV